MEKEKSATPPAKPATPSEVLEAVGGAGATVLMSADDGILKIKGPNMTTHNMSHQVLGHGGKPD